MNSSEENDQFADKRNARHEEEVQTAIGDDDDNDSSSSSSTRSKKQNEVTNDVSLGSRSHSSSDKKKPDHPQKKNDQIFLPIEIVPSVLSFFNLRDLAKYSRVSKSWMRALSHVDFIEITCSGGESKWLNNLELQFALKHFDKLRALHVRIIEEGSEIWFDCNLLRRLLSRCRVLKNFVFITSSERRKSYMTLGLMNHVLAPALPSMQNLEQLYVDCSFCLSDKVEQILHNKVHLRALYLFLGLARSFPLTDKHSIAASIAQCHNLETLHLSLGRRFAELDHQLLFSGLKKLKSFRVDIQDMANNESLKALSNCKNLTKLSIEYLDDEKSVEGLLLVIRSCPVEELEIPLYFGWMVDDSGEQLLLTDIFSLCKESSTLQKINCHYYPESPSLEEETMRELVEAADQASRGRVTLKIVQT